MMCSQHGRTFAIEWLLATTSLLVFFLIACWPAIGEAHIYRPGPICPRPAALPHFNMDRFLGRWYVVQKTRTTADCLVYNITRSFTMVTPRSTEDDSDEDDSDGTRQLRTAPPNNYRIEQIMYMQPEGQQRTRSNNTSSGRQILRTYKLTYAGKLKQGNSSQMSVTFPLNMIGSSTFDVFATDYGSYAGVFSCQPLLFMHRQSTTFLSRTRTLSADTMKMLRYRLYDNNIQELALDDINQLYCGGTEIDIDIRNSGKPAAGANATTMKPSSPWIEKKAKEDATSIEYPDDILIETMDTSETNARSNRNEPLIWI